MKKINVPVIGLSIGTTYNIKQIINLGKGEFIRNFHSIYGNLINSLIPTFLIEDTITNPVFKKIIVLNENNKNKIIILGDGSSHKLTRLQ